MNIGVMFEEQNINSLTTDSEMFVGLYSVIAQAESENISANVRWGIQQRMKKGIYGFHFKTYGYIKGSDGEPEIVPDEAEVVRKVFKLYLNGYSISGIEKYLTENKLFNREGKPFSSSVIRSMLNNEKYVGDLLLQKTYRLDCISKKTVVNNGQLPKYLVSNNHAAIIDRDTFNLVQLEIARRGSKSKKSDNRYEYFEIDELDVINAGLITKALYVNEGITDGVEITDDYDYLLDLADAKRKSISAHYQAIGKNIRPLVLIQFPNGQPETIVAVERKLESMGYTYDNGMVSKWMSEDKKDLPDNLTENDAQPVFLLMKQAISTGWDCPRAKILVKLREGMSENFEIQTIGRIRRMPEAAHYEDDLLDFCYVYTFDEKYKAGLLANMDKA